MKYRLVLLFVIIFSLFLRLKNINRPLLDAHYFRQTQTATVVRNFYLTGIDLFHTKLDIFGTGKEQTILLEFPFFQSMVAMSAHIFGFHDYLGRLVSLIFAIAGGIILVMLVNQFFANRFIALAALVFFLFNPLNFYFQQAYLLESTVVFFHLLAIYSWYRYAKSQKKEWLICATITTSIAFIQKVIYAPFLFLIILGLLYFSLGKEKFKSLHWLPGILLSLLILLSWQYYVDVTNLQNGHANFTLGDPSQQLWNFGTPSERFDAANWMSKLKFIQNSLTKYQWPFFLLGVFLLGLKKEKTKKIVFVWLFSMILYYLLLFRIQSHDYYFMIVMPIVNILAAYGLVTLFNLINGRFFSPKYAKYLFFGIICGYLALFSIKSVQNAKLYFQIDENMQGRLAAYNSVFKESGNALFIFPEYDWNSVYTYYTKRKGIVVAAKDVTDEIVTSFKKDNYRYIVLDGKPAIETMKANNPLLISKYKPALTNDKMVILDISDEK